MAAAAEHAADGDGCTRVSLAELVAFGARVGHHRLPQVGSRGARAGAQVSHVYGRGMDYAESRAYQAGDDVRRLDWRLTARSGTLHTKLFQEDRDGSLLLVVDTHASMRFGTRARYKSVQAARAAAVAAWVVAGAGERVGALAFGVQDGVVRPHAGSRGALAICGALADWDAAAGDAARREPLSQALRRQHQLRQVASRVLLISDGFSADAEARAQLIALRARASLGALVVADALEHADPPAGHFVFEHGGARRDVALASERQRRAFRLRLGAGVDRLRTLADELGLRCQVLDTRDDPMAAVAHVLGAVRARR